MTSEQTKVTVGDGKYTITHTNGIDLKATRHGEPWRDLTGDGMVLALVNRIAELEGVVGKLPTMAPPPWDLGKQSEAWNRGYDAGYQQATANIQGVFAALAARQKEGE